MKNKKRTITLSVLMLVMVLALTYVVTNIGAWLTDQKDTGEISISVGEVRYELKNPNIFVTGPVVPGENIVAGNTLTIQNQSTVKSQIRLTYELVITLSDGVTNPPILLPVTFDNAWVQDGSSLVYYLNGKDGVIDEEDVSIYNVLESIVMDGSIYGNDFRGANISLTITFQAKQADHLTWEKAGSIDFETGLAP